MIVGETIRVCMLIAETGIGILVVIMGVIDMIVTAAMIASSIQTGNGIAIMIRGE